MICENCRKAGEANKMVSEIALADMWRKQERYRAIQFHMMCKDKGCFCQHRVSDINMARRPA